MFPIGPQVRAEGLEPPRAFAHPDLNLARIQIPPRPPARSDRLLRAAARDCMVRLVAEWTTEEGVRLHHPNREKNANKVTKAVVVLLLLVSIALMLIVTIGGWTKLEGAKPGQIGYILVYAVLAFYISRWNRGALPLPAALAILLGIFAAIAGPGWFERDKTG